MRILCANWYGAGDADFERRLFPKIEFIVARAREGEMSPLPEAVCREVDAVINYSPTADLAAPPAAFPKCRIVVRSGVGFDNLDLKGFGARGVPVCNAPDYGTTEVADHALALRLAADDRLRPGCSIKEAEDVIGIVASFSVFDRLHKGGRRSPAGVAEILMRMASGVMRPLPQV